MSMENQELNGAPVAETEEKVEKEAPKARSDKKRDGKKSARPQRAAREPKEYDERVVRISRISKTVKGGRRMRFAALVVIGNGKGKYGFGTGKSTEVPEAIKKSLDDAKAHLKSLPIVKNGTIPHVVEGEFGATKVFLKPANAGTGIVAGGPVRAILELAGIKNVYSKVYGSRCATNIIKATAAALDKLKTRESVKAARFGE